MNTKLPSSTGLVAVDERQGKWRIRLSRSIAKDAARYISTRLDATPENLRKVQRKVFEIEEDLEHDRFDVTLERYSFKPRLTVVKSNTQPELLELWQLYCTHRKSQVAETTYRKEYLLKFPNHIKKFPTQDINQAQRIQEYLLSTVSAGTTKRILTRLNACCQWAVKAGLIKANPFVGMAVEINVPLKNVDSIDPFSKQERDAIITGFESHPKYRHYTQFVRFLFLTGCRTGEAIALQWKHISPDCSVITFSDSYEGSLKIRKCTKTGKVRKFPSNPVLKQLLLSIKPENPQPEDLVFTTVNGLPISNSRFTNQIWKGCRSGKKTYHGVVTGLVKAGKVDRYRCLYNTRHTFITMALEGGMTVPQVAKLVGNSPEVIMRHYAGNTLKFDVPVF